MKKTAPDAARKSLPVTCQRRPGKPFPVFSLPVNLRIRPVRFAEGAESLVKRQFFAVNGTADSRHFGVVGKPTVYVAGPLWNRRQGSQASSSDCTALSRPASIWAPTSLQGSRRAIVGPHEIRLMRNKGRATDLQNRCRIATQTSPARQAANTSDTLLCHGPLHHVSIN